VRRWPERILCQTQSAESVEEHFGATSERKSSHHHPTLEGLAAARGWRLNGGGRGSMLCTPSKQLSVAHLYDAR
jgi:hypothetical protein